MTLGEQIKALRLDRGWTQFDLAQRMEVHDRHVTRWETNKNRPAGRTLEKLAEIFEVTVPELFGSAAPVVEKEGEDGDLRRQFKELQALSPSERLAISMVIDAFLAKKRMEDALHPGQPARRTA